MVQAPWWLSSSKRVEPGREVREVVGGEVRWAASSSRGSGPSTRWNLIRNVGQCLVAAEPAADVLRVAAVGGRDTSASVSAIRSGLTWRTLSISIRPALVR